jgi:hypothetical protein
MHESPIFTRVHDLLKWLLAVTSKFRREQRFVMAARLNTQGFALQDALTAAALDRDHAADHLRQADITLAGLQKSLLLAYELDLLRAGQYRHGSELAREVGRLLGGWQKSVATRGRKAE